MEMLPKSETEAIDSARAASSNGGHRHSSPDREAARRGFVRYVNDRIAAVCEGFTVEGRAWVLCECGNEECGRSIDLTRSEYDALRADARRFAVAPDHVSPEDEVVVSEHGRFAVVETLGGAASRIAGAADPTAPGRADAEGRERGALVGTWQRWATS